MDEKTLQYDAIAITKLSFSCEGSHGRAGILFPPSNKTFTHSNKPLFEGVPSEPDRHLNCPIVATARKARLDSLRRDFGMKTLRFKSTQLNSCGSIRLISVALFPSFRKKSPQPFEMLEVVAV